MKFSAFSLSSEWNDLKKFEKLDLERKQVVFYAENSASFNHFKLLIEELTEKMNIQICYVTSIKNDKIFLNKNNNIIPFYIGDGLSRTKFFLTLKAKILIMDMPDLEQFHIKKSKVYSVHYVYLFHSIFSMHSYLRNGALNNYDTIFCVGQHHIDEIRATEKVYDLKQKTLIKYGFGRLDQLLRESKSLSNSNYDDNLIIISPSYGQNNLIEICGIELINVLLNSNFKVILRPHFRILRDSKPLITSIKNKFCNDPNFLLEEGVLDPRDFHSSKCLITDWSGIGLEYAFTRENKVIFIDVPNKIMNDEYEKIGLEAIEISIRKKIGHIVSPKNLEEIPNLINLNQNKIEGINHIMNQTIFNIDKSANIGAEFIKNFINTSNS